MPTAPPFPRRLAPLLLTLCLACSRNSLRSPAEGGRPVYQVESAHFVVYSDRNADGARELARELESRYVALEQLAFPYDPPLKRRTEVVEFSRWDDLKALGLDWAGVQSDAWESIMGMSTVVFAGNNRSWSTATATHEVTHAFVGHHLPNAPTWLNEGLAEYFETVAFDGDKVVFGHHLTEHVQNIDRTVGLPVDPSQVRTLSELAAMPREEFYGEDRSAHYVSAWATVHALFSPPFRQEFEAYLAALHTGEIPADQALSTHLGAIDQAALRKLAKQTVIGKGLDLRTIQLPRAPETGTSPPQPLAEVEALTLYARMAYALGNTNLGFDFIERAVQLAPDDPEALVVQGRMLIGGGQPDGLERLFEAYRVAAPAERARYAAVLVGMLRSSSPTKRAQLDGMAKELASSAQTPQELEALARYLLWRGRPSAALKYALEALVADPGRPSTLETLASVSAARGEYGSAVKFQERAVNLRGHDASVAAVELLAEYRVKAGQPAPN